MTVEEIPFKLELVQGPRGISKIKSTLVAPTIKSTKF